MLWLDLRRAVARPLRFKAAGDDSYVGHFYDVQTQVNAGSSSLSRTNAKPEAIGEGRDSEPISSVA